MQCPKCRGFENTNRFVRQYKTQNITKRRRECSLCKHRWNTYEGTPEDLVKLLENMEVIQHMEKSKHSELIDDFLGDVA